MGVVHGIRSFVPRMLAQNTDAHIVNTASVAGLVSGSGSPVYSAAKHAVVRVTEALYASSRERNAPVGVTMVCPGLVNTRIYESERSRPERLRPASGVVAETPELQAVAAELYSRALSPEAVAEQVFEAVQARSVASRPARVIVMTAGRRRLVGKMRSSRAARPALGGRLRSALRRRARRSSLPIEPQRNCRAVPTRCAPTAVSIAPSTWT